MSEWTLQRIEAMLGVAQESQELEFKSGDKVNKDEVEDITKTVSSFANASGGTVVFGIKENRESRIAESIVPVDTKVYTAEWFGNILTDNIRPSIDGLKIHEIAYKQDKAILVIEIPMSDLAHQSKDFRYYQRYNFRSHPMFDYQIRDVMGRRRGANPSFGLDISERREGFVIWPHIRNYGPGEMKYYSILICVLAKYVPTNVGEFRIESGNPIYQHSADAPDEIRYLENEEVICLRFDQVTLNSGYVILPGMARQFTNLNFKQNIEQDFICIGQSIAIILREFLDIGRRIISMSRKYTQ